MFEFTETLTLELPSFGEEIDKFQESDYAESHALITQIAAIHEGVTKNFNSYKAEYLEKSLTSWYTPYPRPIIRNHDIHSEPLGRVIGAAMGAEEDGTAFISIQAAITDPAAVAKVGDKRYLTGSVGGRTNEAVCSVCGTDWANPSEKVRRRGMLPCDHRRGQVYKGKLATLEMRGIEWVEYSFVNAPSDTKSHVKSVKQADASDLKALESVPARFFVFNMETPDIKEFTMQESEESENDLVWEQFRDNIRDVMKNNVDFNVNSSTKKVDTVSVGSEESRMTELKTDDQASDEPTDAIEEDDVLDAVDSLVSEQDAASTEVEEGADENSDAEDTVQENDSEEDTGDVEEEVSGEDATGGEELEEGNDSSDQETIEESDEIEDPSLETEGEEVEESRPEGQEKTKSKDATADEKGDRTPKSREEDETGDSDRIAELESELASVRESTSELDSEIESLKEENTKLRNLLKRTLAERVVDAKIVVGLVSREDRASAVAEHATRTASSLVDSIRDLGELKPTADEHKTDVVESQAAGVVEEKTYVEEEDASADSNAAKSPFDTAEELFTDVLMGRKTL